MKILGIHLHPYITFAALRGVPREHALAGVIDRRLDLRDERVKVSKSDFQNVVRSIALTLGDELLGLQVGRHLDFNTLAVIHKISLQATSIEEGVYYCHDYLRKTFPAIEINTRVQGNAFSIVVASPSFEPPVARIILETTLAVMTRELSLMWGRENDISTHSPFCDARYPNGWRKGNEFKITGTAKMLRSSLKDYSRFGLEVLVPAYLRIVELMKPEKSLKSSVKCTALALATPQLPSIERVAFQYNCNVRTFQRRLSSQEFTYRQVVEELKRDLSGMLIRHKRFSVGDISGILGYSEPAAFVRHFRKWHGHPPLQFRKALLQG